MPTGEPGPELPGLVVKLATQVMGWTLIDRKAMGWGEGPPVWSTGEDRDDPNSSPTMQDWRPDVDISAAWKVVENLQQNATDADWLVIRLESDGPEWECTMFDDPLRIIGEARAPTAPLAICLAALAAAEDNDNG